MKPIILFESFPNFTGNSLALYNEFVKRGYDKIYDLRWAVENTFNEQTNYNVIKFFGLPLSSRNKILENVKVIIDSNRYIEKTKNNFRLHVRHGLCFKNVPLYTNAIGNVDALITTSQTMKNVDLKVYKNINDKNIIITGFPNNDYMFSPKNLYETGFLKKKYSKIIGWLPTYRQHNNCSALRCNSKFNFGLPLIKDEKDFNELNEILKMNDVLLLIQLHQNQLMNFKKLPNTENIIFITKSEKDKYKITNADLLGNFDGFITDYSAAYHEYLILNRPIALTIDDLVEYSKSVGFSYNYLDMIKGYYMLDIIDLKKFIKDVKNNKDDEKTNREISLNKIHQYKDANSTNRVMEFLISKKVI